MEREWDKPNEYALFQNGKKLVFTTEFHYPENTYYIPTIKSLVWDGKEFYILHYGYYDIGSFRRILSNTGIDNVAENVHYLYQDKTIEQWYNQEVINTEKNPT